MSAKWIRNGMASVAMIILGLSATCCRAAETPVRIGYFPNVTHAQAVLGASPERQDFAKALGKDVKVETRIFNAGPSVIEAMFGGQLDIGYLGPSPVINGWLASKGDSFRVIAGAANNGVVIIGNKKLGITKLEQLKGKRVATPQLGNTQDISAKYYLVHELKATLKERGGDTSVLPISNPDIEIALEKDQIEGAWVPEPWGARLIQSGLANLLAEEKDLWDSKKFTLTVVIVRREFLDAHPDLVEKFLQAHVSLTRELQQNPKALADAVNKEIKRLTTKDLPAQVLADSLSRIEFTLDPLPDSFTHFYDKGRTLGLIRSDEGVDLKKMFDSTLLDKAAKDTPTTASAAK